MQTIIPGVSDEEFRSAIRKEAEKKGSVRESCTHQNYQGMQKHGRCCPDCGTCVVDWGD